MNTENLLIEVGTEELPPKSLKKLAESLAANFEQELEKLSLTFETINWMAAPRRLALTVTSLAGSQADKVIDKKGPAISAAFDAEGNPTKAAQGWAKSNGIDVSQAEKLETDKGAWLLHRAKVEGKSVTEIIPEALRQALAKLPIPKPKSSLAEFTLGPKLTGMLKFSSSSIFSSLFIPVSYSSI